jgi:hypothetical protein
MLSFARLAQLAVLAALGASTQLFAQETGAPAGAPAPAAAPANNPLSSPARHAPLPPVSQPAKHYEVHRASKPIVIDGKLDDKGWKKAPWTDDFVDIEGPDKKPNPRFKTHAKMLWDDNYLYIAAELEEPDVKAALTQHDAPLFHENDFEVFVRPVESETGYFEFEMNALNTTMDLYFSRQGARSDSAWDIEGLKTAVAVQGTLNNSDDTDKGWTLEIAYPWRSFLSRMPTVTQPKVGTEWRFNMLRVEWKAGQPREDNWSWSPQGVVNMHVPDRWGYVLFVKK